MEFVQLQLESPVGRGTRWNGWETLLGLIRRRFVGVDDEGTVREVGMVEEVETADLEKCEKERIMALTKEATSFFGLYQMQSARKDFAGPRKTAPDCLKINS